MMWNRRQFIGLTLGGSMVALAGCTGSDGSVEMPEVEWGFGTVTGEPDKRAVIYQGGDEITTDNTEHILIEVDDETRATLEPPIRTRGESVAVEASEGETISVIWVSPADETQQEMATHDV